MIFNMETDLVEKEKVFNETIQKLEFEVIEKDREYTNRFENLNTRVQDNLNEKIVNLSQYEKACQNLLDSSFHKVGLHGDELNALKQKRNDMAKKVENERVVQISNTQKERIILIESQEKLLRDQESQSNQENNGQTSLFDFESAIVEKKTLIEKITIQIDILKSESEEKIQKVCMKFDKTINKKDNELEEQRSISDQSTKLISNLKENLHDMRHEYNNISELINIYIKDLQSNSQDSEKKYLILLSQKNETIKEQESRIDEFISSNKKKYEEATVYYENKFKEQKSTNAELKNKMKGSCGVSQQDDRSYTVEIEKRDLKIKALEKEIENFKRSTKRKVNNQEKKHTKEYTEMEADITDKSMMIENLKVEIATQANQTYMKEINEVENIGYGSMIQYKQMLKFNDREIDLSSLESFDYNFLVNYIGEMKDTLEIQECEITNTRMKLIEMNKKFEALVKQLNTKNVELNILTKKVEILEHENKELNYVLDVQNIDIKSVLKTFKCDYADYRPGKALRINATVNAEDYNIKLEVFSPVRNKDSTLEVLVGKDYISPDRYNSLRVVDQNNTVDILSKDILQEFTQNEKIAIFNILRELVSSLGFDVSSIDLKNRDDFCSTNNKEKLFDLISKYFCSVVCILKPYMASYACL